MGRSPEAGELTVVAPLVETKMGREEKEVRILVYKTNMYNKIPIHFCSDSWRYHLS